MKKYWLCFLLSPSLFAQIPVGTWRTHAAYNEARSVAVSPEKVFAGTSGGLFVLDKQDNSLTPYSRLDGFSETDIRKLAYDPASQTLVIAYANGNLDLLKNNSITNLPQLKNSAQIPDKTINALTISCDRVYLAMNFGVVVLDLTHREIRETWQNLGSNGSSISVFAAAFARDSLFLATSQGIIAARTTANLQDFNNWKTYGTTQGLPAGKAVKTLATQGIEIVAGIENDGIYPSLGGKFIKLPLPVSQLNNLQFVGGQLVISSPGLVQLRNPDGSFSALVSALLQNPQEVSPDAQGKFWIADLQNSLLNYAPGSFQSLLPASPFRRQVFRLYAYHESVVAVAGGYNGSLVAGGSQAGFYVFEKEGWQNFNVFAQNPARKIPDVKDLSAIFYNPADQNLYLGSFGNGLLVIKPDGSFEVLDSLNSPLPTEANITGITADAEGNVWLCLAGRSTSQAVLYQRRPDKSWQSYAINNFAAASATDLLIDANGYKWLISQSQGLLVFDEKTGKSRLLTMGNGQGGLPGNNITCFMQDLDGTIWLGSEKGVSLFANISQALERGADAVPPVFERRPLLRDEVITAIAVDGGNRKWFGTRWNILQPRTARCLPTKSQR
jgi:ligand-binding sensor domain-containing protein